MSVVLKILRFNRIAASVLAERLARFSVPPNAVTTASLLAGLAAACLFASSFQGALLAGAFCMHLGFVLDCCDGELARRTSRTSSFGKWFDVATDGFVEQALWLGLFIGAGSSFSRDGAALLAASAGSAINFRFLMRERREDCSFHAVEEKSASRRQNLFFAMLESLAHNGASILLVWGMAFYSDARGMLWGAAVFVHFLWIARAAANAKTLFGSWKKAGKEILWIGGLAAGVLLLFDAIARVSLDEMRSLLARGGPAIALTFLVFPLTLVFHTAGLAALLPVRSRERVSFKSLYAINLSCEAVNRITPFVDVGGDPFKVVLAQRKGAATEDAVAAVFSSRLVYIASEIACILSALAIGGFLSFGSPHFQVGMGGIAVSVVFMVILMASAKGIFRLLARNDSGVAARSRESLRDLWMMRRRDVVSAFFWNVLGWITGFFEIYLALILFGESIGATGAYVVHHILQAVKSVTFFIPGNIGAQENGLAHLLTALGYSATHGLGLSVLLRLRQFAWAGVTVPIFAVAWRDSRKSFSR